MYEFTYVVAWSSQYQESPYELFDDTVKEYIVFITLYCLGDFLFKNTFATHSKIELGPKTIAWVGGNSVKYLMTILQYYNTHLYIILYPISSATGSWSTRLQQSVNHCVNVSYSLSYSATLGLNSGNIFALGLMAMSISWWVPLHSCE